MMKVNYYRYILIFTSLNLLILILDYFFTAIHGGLFGVIAGLLLPSFVGSMDAARLYVIKNRQRGDMGYLWIVSIYFASASICIWGVFYIFHYELVYLLSPGPYSGNGFSISVPVWLIVLVYTFLLCTLIAGATVVSRIGLFLGAQQEWERQLYKEKYKKD